MELEQVKQFVQKKTKELCFTLQLQDWRINFEYITLDNPANCAPLPGYKKAIIQIDPIQQEDEADLLRTLRHELLHCFLAEQETYRKAVGELTTNREFNAIDAIFRQAVEATVNQIERMLDVPTV